MRGRHAPLLLGFAAAFLLLTGCLGPNDLDRTGRAPVGRLESVTASALGIRVTGWAADPDTSLPVPVLVGTTTERRVVTVVADRARPDLAGRRRVRGTAHGFEVLLPWTSAGPRQVCVGVRNVGAGRDDRLLGCPSVVVPGRHPLGAVQSVVLGPSAADGTAEVVLTGWAFDADLQDPIDVSFFVDGDFVVRRPAEVRRPDIGGFFGRDPRVGFSYSLPLEPGRHTVCVRAENVGSGQDAELGCRPVDVPAPAPDHRPTGAIVVAEPVEGGVALSGTATDPDGPVAAATVEVRSRAGTATRTVPVVDGQFTTMLDGLPDGPVRLCVTLRDLPPMSGVAGQQGDRVLPCASAVVGGPLRAGTTGGTDLLPVRPPDGHPLAGIDRDAGVSTVLSDGSVFWVFADSLLTDPRGDVRAFLNNTAVVTAPGALARTEDVTSVGAPVPFAAPDASFPPCPAERPQRALWPLSAVAKVVDGAERVAVLMSEMCIGEGAGAFTYRGVALVEWVRPAAAAPPAPVRGTVVRHQLLGSDEPPWGEAALVDQDGQVVLYACVEAPSAGCGAARAPFESLADRSTWTYLDGDGSWQSDRAAAATMVLPADLDDPEVPRASFGVAYDPVHHVYIMGYVPWPAISDRLAVRVATLPTGPWTAPLLVNLPGCNSVVAGVEQRCYAGAAQPAFSSDGLLGLGFYDQRLRTTAAGGQYFVVRIPFTVVLNP